MKCSSCGTEIEGGADMGGDSASRAVRLKTNRSILLYVIFGMLPILTGIIPLVYILLK